MGLDQIKIALLGGPGTGKTSLIRQILNIPRAITWDRSGCEMIPPPFVEYSQRKEGAKKFSIQLEIHSQLEINMVNNYLRAQGKQDPLEHILEEENDYHRKLRDLARTVEKILRNKSNSTIQYHDKYEIANMSTSNWSKNMDQIKSSKLWVYVKRIQVRLHDMGLLGNRCILVEASAQAWQGHPSFEREIQKWDHILAVTSASEFQNPLLQLKHWDQSRLQTFQANVSFVCVVPYKTMSSFEMPEYEKIKIFNEKIYQVRDKCRQSNILIDLRTIGKVPDLPPVLKSFTNIRWHIKEQFHNAAKEEKGKLEDDMEKKCEDLENERHKVWEIYREECEKAVGERAAQSLACTQEQKVFVVDMHYIERQRCLKRIHVNSRTGIIPLVEFCSSLRAS